MARLWNGTLTRGVEAGTVIGEIRDEFGFTIVLTGTKAATGYAITGTPGPIPAEYWIECIDGPKPDVST
jgi:hypothetical protein